jgi:hypothetical protein
MVGQNDDWMDGRLNDSEKDSWKSRYVDPWDGESVEE